MFRGSSLYRTLIVVITFLVSSGCAQNVTFLSRTTWNLADSKPATSICKKSQPTLSEKENKQREELLSLVRLNLDNEDPDAYPQIVNVPRGPLQLFPRLTTPFVAELYKKNGTENDNKGGWTIPLVLDRKAADIPMGAKLEQVKERFSFWLDRHGERNRVTQQPMRIDDCLVLMEENKDDRVELLIEIPYDESLIKNPYDECWIENPCNKKRKHESGFFDIRILPRIRPEGEMKSNDSQSLERSQSNSRIVNMLYEGNWFGLLAKIDQAAKKSSNLEELELPDQYILARLEDPESVPPYFLPELRNFKNAIENPHLLSNLENSNKTSEDPRGGALAALRERVIALTNFDHSAAPVLLDSGSGEFSFVVGADIQYSSNLDALRRFFEMLDPTIDRPRSPPPPYPAVHAVDPRVRDAKFVVLVGDIADAEAGSAKGLYALGVLGLRPPRSPYVKEGHGEYDGFRRELLRFSKPVFAVPGNHDGFVGYGGLLNNLLDGFGLVPGLSFLAKLSDWTPTLIQWRVIPIDPRYDGLKDWQNHLGTLNFSFRFREHAFVGLNTYDLTQRERGGAGSAFINWGGGLQQKSFENFTQTLNSARQKNGRKFLFMHHDPRAGIPNPSTYEENQFGIYDAIDNLFSMLTFGYAGLGFSPLTSLNLPLITPVSSYALRFFDTKTSEGGEWQQEWMRRPDYEYAKQKSSRIWWHWSSIWGIDEDGYQSHQLVKELNSLVVGNVGDCSPTIGFCLNTDAYLFFGHNDTPLISTWVDDQGYPFRNKAIFPGNWFFSDRFLTKMKAAFLPAVKLRNDAPFEWTYGLRPDNYDNENATVIRLDDIGNVGASHGFHLVTVRNDGMVEIEKITIPQ